LTTTHLLLLAVQPNEGEEGEPYALGGDFGELRANPDWSTETIAVRP
jgi:hypothetical protein